MRGWQLSLVIRTRRECSKQFVSWQVPTTITYQAQRCEQAAFLFAWSFSLSRRLWWEGAHRPTSTVKVRFDCSGKLASSAENWYVKQLKCFASPAGALSFAGNDVEQIVHNLHTFSYMLKYKNYAFSVCCKIWFASKPLCSMFILFYYLEPSQRGIKKFLHFHFVVKASWTMKFMKRCCRERVGILIKVLFIFHFEIKFNFNFRRAQRVFILIFWGKVLKRSASVLTRLCITDLSIKTPSVGLLNTKINPEHSIPPYESFLKPSRYEMLQQKVMSSNYDLFLPSLQDLGTQESTSFLTLR